MGLGETTNFSIFTFNSASDLYYLTALLLLSHDEVLKFEWKSLQNDDVITLWYSIGIYLIFL